MKAAILFLVGVPLLAGCGGDGPPSGIDDPGDTHDQLVFEAMPFDAIGQNRIVFHRAALFHSGLVTVDGAARTVVATYTPNREGRRAREISAAPGGGRIAYTRQAPLFGDAEPSWDINVRDLNAMTGLAAGGAGGRRGAPSWSPDGSRIVFGETGPQSGPLFNRIVSMSASLSGRQILWEASCDYADAPSLNGNGDLVFLYYPEAGNCGFGRGRIARKSPTGAVAIIYTGSDAAPNLKLPIWSPSGLEVAFLAYGIPTSPDLPLPLTLYIIAPDGSNLRSFPLPKPWIGGSDISFCWGKDGSRLFLSLRDDQASAHIYSIRPDGTAFTSITTVIGVTDEWVSCA